MRESFKAIIEILMMMVKRDSDFALAEAIPKRIALYGLRLLYMPTMGGWGPNQAYRTEKVRRRYSPRRKYRL